MPISIGIITARQSMDNIRQTEQSMKQHCKISYFPYDTLDELRHQYTKAAAKSDGLLFSGPFPHDYICENIGRITLPCRCIDLMDRRLLSGHRPSAGTQSKAGLYQSIF